MACIIIKRNIVRGLRFPPRLQEGSFIPFVNINNDFECETPEEIKRYWDSLNESEQRHFIEIYVQENGNLENILRDAMRKNRC